jgi:hypothetical protein
VRAGGQRARQHLAVDRIGDHQAAVLGAPQQAQIEQVVAIRLRHDAERGPGQHRLDEAAHPRLAQLVGELIQVGDAAQDQVLLGLVDQRDVDGAGAVAPGGDLEAALVGQRIDQPGLALGQVPDPLQGLGREDLPGLGRVLAEQRGHLLGGEVPQAQRLGLDVEGTAAGDRRRLGAGVDAVVAQIPHPAQHHRGRKGRRALRVARAQLAQQRDQRVADQGVHLVEEQDQGLRALPPQRFSRPLSTPSGPYRGQTASVHSNRRSSPSVELGRGRNRPADRAHAAGDVLAGGLGRFQIGIDGPITPLVVEPLHQRQQTGGLAGLARGVQQEILLLLDQPQDLGQVPAVQGRQAVVHVGPHRTLGVEEAHDQTSLGTAAV